MPDTLSTFRDPNTKFHSNNSSPSVGEIESSPEKETSECPSPQKMFITPVKQPEKTPEQK